MKVNAPKLRFKEFADEWQEKKLGEIFKIGSGRDYKHLDAGNIPVYGTGGLMLNVNNYLYEGESICIGRKGTIDKPQFLNGKFWTVDTLFYTYDFKNSIPKFIFPIFQKINWQKYNEASGVPSLSKTTIEKIKVFVPSLPEQQKIADFLGAVDEKVEKLDEKKKAFEKYKKGVMQKIFPSTGSGQAPQIRFKNENGGIFPDWEEKKLGEIGEIVGGGTPDTTKHEYWDGIVYWLTPTEVKTKYISHSLRKISESGLKNSSAKLLPEGAVIFTSRATVGDVGISEVEITTNQGFQSIIVNKSNSNEFLYYWIKNNKREFLRKASGSTFLEISKAEMLKIKGIFPIKDEQEKIAEFLTVLDNKINLITNQLQQARLFKKSLLQRMFV